MNLTILLLLLALAIGLLVWAVLLTGSMSASILSGGAPFVPTRTDRCARMVAAARLQAQDRVVDLGSGDGRLVIHAVEAGAEHGTGVEVLPHLNARARKAARAVDAHAQTRFVTGSMWKADLSGYDVVFAYQITYAMHRLGRKFERELKPGARVVCNAFDIPDWTPVREEPGIYVYEIGKHKTPG